MQDVQSTPDDTESAGSSEASFVKKSAAEAVSHLTESRRLILDEHTHMFRWLTGSLLALNGGAAIGTLSADQLANTTKAYACAAFLAGIILALLVGVASQRLNRRSLVPLNRIIGYWVSVAHDGERVEEYEEELNKDLVSQMSFGWIAQAIGWLSGLMLVLGGVFIGIHLLEMPLAEATPSDLLTIESAGDQG